jgi:hypothetical protein
VGGWVGVVGMCVCVGGGGGGWICVERGGQGTRGVLGGGWKKGWVGGQGWVDKGGPKVWGVCEEGVSPASTSAWRDPPVNRPPPKQQREA